MAACPHCNEVVPFLPQSVGAISAVVALRRYEGREPLQSFHMTEELHQQLTGLGSSVPSAIVGVKVCPGSQEFS
jgi:hypothetical protein